MEQIVKLNFKMEKTVPILRDKRNKQTKMRPCVKSYESVETKKTLH